MKLNWSELSQTDYWENIDYLLKEWSEKEALVFIEKVEAVLQIITIKPNTFRKSGHRNTHFVPITPQISLYYRILDANTVELVRFWNNYQNPERLKV